MSKNETNLQITLPKTTKKSLRLLAAERGEPMRLIVLEALSKIGVEVPKEEIQDKRKTS